MVILAQTFCVLASSPCVASVEHGNALHGQTYWASLASLIERRLEQVEKKILCHTSNTTYTYSVSTTIFACQFRVLRTFLHRNLTHPCSSLMLKWRGACFQDACSSESWSKPSTSVYHLCRNICPSGVKCAMWTLRLSSW